jgi:hypothetical protein
MLALCLGIGRIGGAAVRVGSERMVDPKSGILQDGEVRLGKTNHGKERGPGAAAGGYAAHNGGQGRPKTHRIETLRYLVLVYSIRSLLWFMHIAGLNPSPLASNFPQHRLS